MVKITLIPTEGIILIPTSKKAVSMLWDVRELLKDPYHWVQEAATNDAGDSRGYEDEDATCFCLNSAILRVGSSYTWDTINVVMEELCNNAGIYDDALAEEDDDNSLERAMQEVIINWNDSEHRTFDEVADLLDRSIKLMQDPNR